MRTIERTTVFRRDFKREKRGRYSRDLNFLISESVSLLAEDRPLRAKFRDQL